jgi:hypothetical protein
MNCMYNFCNTVLQLQKAVIHTVKGCIITIIFVILINKKHLSENQASPKYEFTALK